MIPGGVSPPLLMTAHGPSDQLVTMPSSSNWQAVAWNGSGYCVVSGSDKAALSADGVTWAEHAMPAGSGTGWLSVTWNGNVWCSLGGNSVSNNKAATSPDGVNWTAQTLADVENWFTVIAGGTLLAAIHGDDTNTSSNNGATWASHTSVIGLGATNGVGWNGSVFVVLIDGSNQCATSPDAITWTPRSMPSSADWWAVAWNGSVFCAVTYDDAKVATSPDGTTWTAHTLPFSQGCTGIAWNGSLFCAMGIHGDRCAFSADGATWTEYLLTNPLGSLGTPGYQVIASDGAKFVVIKAGTSGLLITP